MPTDDWNVKDYAAMAAELSDPDNNVYGTNYLPGNYYDFESLVRAYNGSILDEQRDNFFYGDLSFEEGMQAVQDACQEIMELPRV